MTEELRLKNKLNDALNWLDKAVGEHVKDFQQVVSRNEERNCYLVTVRATCRKSFCKHVVEATAANTTEGWGRLIVSAFIRRAEHHAKSHLIFEVKSTMPSGRKS